MLRASYSARGSLRAAALHAPEREGFHVAAGATRAVPTWAVQAGRPELLVHLATAWRSFRRAVVLVIESARVGHVCVVKVKYLCDLRRMGGT